MSFDAPHKKPLFKSGLDQWVPSPQSQDPSPSAQPTPSASKPASIAFPSADSGLPTPDQTMPSAAVDICEPPLYSGRGKRLTAEEELCLIRLCRLHMKHYDTSEHQKSFWIMISDVFLIECGRPYSWQSCRRRISTLIANRKAYWAALDQGRPPPPDSLQNEITREVDKWIWACDAEAEVQQRKRELEQAKAAVAKERQRLDEERQRLEVAQREAQRKYSQQRIRDWVNNNPDPTHMKPLPQHWGETPVLPNHRYRSRSRSRSPRRSSVGVDGNGKYRQRSPPPAARPLPLSAQIGGVWRDPLNDMFKPERESRPLFGPLRTGQEQQHRMPPLIPWLKTRDDPVPTITGTGLSGVRNDTITPNQPARGPRRTPSYESEETLSPALKAAIDDAVRAATAQFRETIEQAIKTRLDQQQRLGEKLESVETAVDRLHHRFEASLANIEAAVLQISEKKRLSDKQACKVENAGG